MSDSYDRQAAWDLLCEYTKTDPLRKHALAVEAAMRAYAGKFGGDEEQWGIVGLLHDFDYEAHPNPEEHPVKGAEIMRQRGWPEEIIYAVLCHADYLGLERKSPMDRAIYAVDELTGLIIAVALVRPSKSIQEVDVRAVRKKMKDKSFARAVNREDITNGADQLSVDLEEHIGFVIEALKPVANELGIAGTSP
ncbi:MAG: HDIG domain-containing protein [Chloroflexi bacterium]|nr:HDIG domain-containing protein [Chloroflexota bacterium]